MMADRDFMVPATQDGAASQMMIEQIRRLADAIDRLTSMVSEMQQQLARIDAENRHTVERREKNEAWLHSVDKRVDALEAWRAEQRGERGFIGLVLRSPLLGLLAAASAILWAAIKGKAGQ